PKARNHRHRATARMISKPQCTSSQHPLAFKGKASPPFEALNSRLMYYLTLLHRTNSVFKITHLRA
ncbi:MAG: hypothetical protein VXA39_11755, partial [Deltaproteobacteria bacterium]